VGVVLYSQYALANHALDAEEHLEIQSWGPVIIYTGVGAEEKLFLFKKIFLPNQLKPRKLKYPTISWLIFFTQP
jgi:hypothetical protein